MMRMPALTPPSIRRVISAALVSVATIVTIAPAGPVQAQGLGDVMRNLGENLSTAAQTAQSGQGGAPNAVPYETASPGRGPIEAPDPRAHHLDWDTKFTSTGLANRKLVGHDFLFYCPPAPSKLTPRRLFGTDRYAFHSVVCRAALHAGRIDLSGGNVTVRMLEGNMRLAGSTRNGVRSDDGPSGIRTLVFVD